MSQEPKILLWDIETSHNIVASFQLRDEYTPHTNILQERFVICAAWKWLGEKKVHTVSVMDDSKRFSKDVADDKHVIETLHKVLSEADVIIAHNGDRFDTKFIETRALFHGLPALPPITSIDTYKVAKARFMFNSNRLDYLGKFLGFGGKKSTPAGLWLDVLKGDKKAIKTMVDYNKRDVTLLENVFLKLRPYVANHINREIFGKVGCPRCGSKKVQSRGFHRAITKTYRRFQCQKCSGWFRDLKGGKATTQSRVL
jgi:hypothetical protein